MGRCTRQASLADTGIWRGWISPSPFVSRLRLTAYVHCSILGEVTLCLSITAGLGGEIGFRLPFRI